MEATYQLLATLGVGVLGGLLGYKLKIPAGGLIGAMVFVAAYNMWTGKGYMPVSLKLIAQIIVGCMIGLNFTPDAIGGLKGLAVPALMLVGGLLTFSLGLGFFILKMTGLDLVTALFSCSPGGLTDMTLIADAYGAETHKVAVMHLMRLVTVITVLPLLIRSVYLFSTSK